MNNVIELINKLKVSSIILWCCFYLSILIVSGNSEQPVTVEDFLTPKGIDILVKAFALLILLLYIVSSLIWMLFLWIANKIIRHRLSVEDYEEAATYFYKYTKKVADSVVEEHTPIAKYVITSITAYKNNAPFFMCLTIQLSIIFHSKLYYGISVLTLIISFIISICAVFIQKLREHYAPTQEPTTVIPERESII